MELNSAKCRPREQETNATTRPRPTVPSTVGVLQASGARELQPGLHSLNF